MDVLKTTCPQCARPLEVPRDFDNVICAACGAAFRVRAHKNAINLSPITSASEPGQPPTEETALDARLAEVAEEIERMTEEIDESKSKEKSAPLQLGCGIFGIFWLVIAVIAVFMTVAKSYFGTWLFYSSLAVVIIVGILRLRRRRTTPEELDRLHQEQVRLGEELDDLVVERDSLLERRGLTVEDRQSG